MNILLPTLRFPPFSSAGSLRLARFAQHFCEFGGKVTVVTASLSDLMAGYPRREQLDMSLLSDCPSELQVLRTESVREAASVPRNCARAPRRNDLLDNGVYWNRIANQTCEELVVDDGVDCIYTSSNPLSAHLLGEALCQKFGIPWVCEFRDPWTTSPFKTWRSRSQYRYERQLEERILRTCTKVIVNTPTARGDLLDSFDWLSPSKVSVVTNSFPAALSRGPERSRVDDEGPLVVSHVGTMRGIAPPRESMRSTWRRRVRHLLRRNNQYKPVRTNRFGNSPWYFLLGLRQFLQADPANAGRIRFVLAGRFPSENDVRRLREVVEELGLDEVVEYRGVVPHEEALAIMEESDALLVNQEYPVGIRRCPVVPAKVYEYLRMGRPVIGMLPPGDARDFLASSGLGLLTAPDSPSEVASTLQRLWDGRADLHSLGGLADSFVERFRSDLLARQVWDQFRSITEGACQPAVH